MREMLRLDQKRKPYRSVKKWVILTQIPVIFLCE